MEKERLIEWRLWQLWPLLVAPVNSPKLQDWRKRSFWPKLSKIEECQSLITVVPQLSFPKISPLKTLKVRDGALIWSQRYSGIQAGIFLRQFNHDHSGLDSSKAVFQKLKIIFTRSLTLSYFQSLIFSRPT